MCCHLVEAHLKVKISYIPRAYVLHILYIIYIYIYLEIYPKEYVFLHNPTDDNGITSCDIYSRTPSLSHHTVTLSQSIHCNNATTNTVLRILILSNNNNNSHFHLVQWVINGSSANNSFAHGWLAVAHIKPASPKEELK